MNPLLSTGISTKQLTMCFSFFFFSQGIYKVCNVASTFLDGPWLDSTVKIPELATSMGIYAIWLRFMTGHGVATMQPPLKSHVLLLGFDDLITVFPDFFFLGRS